MGQSLFLTDTLVSLEFVSKMDFGFGYLSELENTLSCK